MHNTIRVGEMNVTFLRTRHETGDAFDLFELTVPPFARVPFPHLHRVAARLASTPTAPTRPHASSVSKPPVSWATWPASPPL
jgi:hypothetical protein